MDDGIKSEEVVRYHRSDFDALEWFEEAWTQYSGRLPLAAGIQLGKIKSLKLHVKRIH